MYDFTAFVVLFAKVEYEEIEETAETTIARHIHTTHSPSLLPQQQTKLQCLKSHYILMTHISFIQNIFQTL